jgi:fatty aldehyde-generating acyl-ACP reductase
MYPGNVGEPWFAFVMHPRDVQDLDNIRAVSFLRRYSASEEEYIAKACSVPPIVAGNITFGAAPIRGEFVCASRMPRQIITRSGRELVLETALIGARRGARVIGLGALTAPATYGGESLVAHMPPGVVVTNGNSFTAAVARDNVWEAARAIGLGPQATVAIVGATGSVGLAASELLADDGFDLILIGRRPRVIAEVLGALEDRANVTVSADLMDARRAQVVVALTSKRSARLAPELFDPGTVIVDLAQPANVDMDGDYLLSANGVLVTQGGIVVIPRHCSTLDLRLAGAEDTFACCAETYLMALEGWNEHSVGRGTATLARSMSGYARRHGVRSRPLPGLGNVAGLMRARGADDGRVAGPAAARGRDLNG